MRKPTVLTPIALLIVLVVMSRADSAPKPAASQPDSGDAKEDSAAIKPLLGKWIVRSVEHEAKPTGAQIGQKRGDIIKFARGADGDIALT
jgi:hypothetical protein